MLLVVLVVVLLLVLAWMAWIPLPTLLQAVFRGLRAKVCHQHRPHRKTRTG